MADEEISSPHPGEARRETAPLEDLADRVRARRTADPATPSEPGTDDEDPWGLGEFLAEESYDGLESEELWESIGSADDLDAGVDIGEAPDEHIVPKRSYCEPCEHFTAPPEVRCGHAGTTIVDFPDIDHVRVRNCPIVAERRALEEQEGGPLAADSTGGQPP